MNLKKSLSHLRTIQFKWPLRGCRVRKDCYTQPHLQLSNTLSVWSTPQAKVRNNGIAPHTSHPEAGATFETPLAICLAHVPIIKNER